MNLDELTLGQIKEISAFFGSTKSTPEESPFEVGKKYFIRTVTLYYVGTCEKLYGSSMHLKDASWIPDTGRFADSLQGVPFKECEPYKNGVNVWFGGIVDHTEFEGDLPTEQK